jgi:hypothetical protein
MPSIKETADRGVSRFQNGCLVMPMKPHCEWASCRRASLRSKEDIPSGVGSDRWILGCKGVGRFVMTTH